MPRLPTPGADNGSWGTILNEYLTTSLDGSGNLKATALTAAGSELVANKNQPNGYAGLDSTGQIDSAQLPASSTSVAAYIGLYADLTNIASNDFVGVNFTHVEAQLDDTSINWDSENPDQVTVLKTGVYSVTAGAYWRDPGGSGPLCLQITSSCAFNFADIRPAIGDGMTGSQQYLTATMYLQANQNIRLNIQQTMNITVNPDITMLVTRCA